MGKKLLVALAMEGKFAADGLQAIDGDDDMLTAMARELVENRGIGESADSVWRRLCPAPAVPRSENSAEPASVPAEVSMPEPLLVIADQIPPASWRLIQWCRSNSEKRQLVGRGVSPRNATWRVGTVPRRWPFISRRRRYRCRVGGNLHHKQHR
jgi:hypothetical protein